MSTPSSIINVCSGVRLNPSYEHTIYFTSLSNQLSYFQSKRVHQFTGYTYLRKAWNIKVSVAMETAKTWDYLYFANGSGKTYFYFITNIEYVSDTVTELFLELDVMQTYFFDYTLLPCFVEREHTSNDAIGANNIDEDLELGEYFENSQFNIDIDECVVMTMATYNPQYTSEQDTDTVFAKYYNKTFSGLGIYATRWQDLTAMATKLKLLDEYGKSDGIISLWLYPKSLVQLKDDSWDSGIAFHEIAGVGNINSAFSRNETLNGYTPKNNKLFTYPFNFLYVTNNVGNAGVFQYEKFDDASNCEFKITGAISPEASVVMYPLNYNGAVLAYEHGMSLGNFPTCAWNQDIYKLWLAQNQNSQSLALLSGGLKIAAGIGTAAITGGVGTAVGGGMIASGASQIAGQLAQRKDMEVQPPQAKGTMSTNVNYVSGFQTFTVKKKSVDAIHAKIIDDYFTMYGYATKQVKIPNRNVRENWTYTKTIGCHIDSNLCTDDVMKIESIYNNGITFWKNGTNIANYSLSNGIL